MKKGFTLIELLVVMAILAIIMTIMVGILDPAALLNKGYDAQKKKDVNRIKVAFEEYANDNKGCFPTEAVINDKGLLIDSNCNKNVFAPWLSSWPCAPQGKHYLIYTEPSNCPKWFKVATKLDNLKDTDIPIGILPSTVMGGEITGLTANYGVSSTNIKWWDGFVSPVCLPILECFTSDHGPCDSTPGCSGDHCFASNVDVKCNPACNVGTDGSCPYP